MSNIEGIHSNPNINTQDAVVGASGDSGIFKPEYVPEEKTKKASDKTKSEEDKPKVQECAFCEYNRTWFLDVIKEDGSYGFVSEKDGKIVFQPTIALLDGTTIYPCKLNKNQDTHWPLFYIGIPTAEMVMDTPLLSADELYKLIEDHVTRYVDLPPLEIEMMIHYILYTWLYTKVPTSPYLRFIADTGKGKSRCLKVAGNLSMYPIKTTGSSSHSGIIRLHEKWKGTMVIDEGDFQGGSSDPKTKFLNCGFERGSFHVLTNMKDFNQQEIFDPFGPKIIAMREAFGDNATETRCISISPSETSNLDIPSELGADYDREVAEIQAAIAKFMLHNWPNIDGKKLIDNRDLNVEPRLKQTMRPVSIVIQLLPDHKEGFIEYCKIYQKSLKRQRSMSLDGIIFNTAHELSKAEDSSDQFVKDFICSKDISDKLDCTSTKVSQTLFGIGFVQESHHYTDTSGQRHTVRKLVVPSARKWREIIQRYDSGEDGQMIPECPKSLRSRTWKND